MVYLRFLSAQNDAMPITTATAAAAMMAKSVVLNSGASDGSVGSGSNCCAGDGAGSTVRVAAADELP